jgi:threonine dehydratase
MFTLSMDDFQEVRARIAQHTQRTPLLTSRQLNDRTGLDLRLKAELFKRVGELEAPELLRQRTCAFA